MPRARESNPLADPVRVAALRGTGLIGTKQSEAFDRVARLAATFVKAPMAMVALLDGTHLHALSRIGPPDLAKAQRTPVKDVFCRHVVASGEALIVKDAREHEQTAGLASVKSGKVLAYAGIPLRLASGHVLGTLCVADAKPRAWKASELAVLEDLARSAVTEIEVRADVEARRELQRANVRLRGVLENSPVPIYAKDLEGKVLFANAAAEGATDEEAITFPLLDEAGEPYGTCGIVSARGDTAAAMAFEHAPTGMAMIGTDGHFTRVNAALAELTGRSEEQLLGMTLPQIVHREEWAARTRLFERMLTGEIRTHQTQGRLVSGIGEPRWVLVNATALTDAGGWPTEFFVQFQDITEETRGQQLLRARHDVTRVLAQAATVEQAAPLLLEALGGNLGWQVGALWLADDESGELSAVASWRHRSFDGEMPSAPLALDDLPVRVSHSGDPVWTEALMAGAASERATAIAAAGLSGAVCLPIISGEDSLGAIEFYCRELEEPDEQLRELLATIGMPIGLFILRQRAIGELAAARDEALEATALKSQFLANMSHELRTPMHGVIGMAELLLESELSEEQHNYAAMVKASGEQLLTIINDILDLSKIEAGRLELEHAEFNLSDAVDEAVELLAERARGKGLDLGAFVERKARLEVVGDRFRLQQVLTNLVSNAVKFTSSGEITVRVTEGEPSPRGRRVRFDVADTGVGIDAAQAGRLFEPFSQADSSTTRKHGGTGLGLSICRELVELMGGEIGAVGERGRGSTFWFTVDLEVVAEAPEPEPEPAAAAPEVPVLVVDDNAVNRMVAAEMLRKRGYRVEVAKNGEEAVAAAAAEPFAVILMDCHMPVMDGYEATRAIRASEDGGPRVAIVAMTSDTVDSVREACFDAGMDDYLAKPVTGETLGEAIERWRPGEEVPAVDLDVLDELTRETSGGRDSQLMKSLAGLFREDSSRGLKQVADALRERDAPAVARAAHALKGSSSQLGATRTEAISAELQAVAESGELGSAKALLRRLETAVDAAQSALSSALPEEENASK